MHIGQIEGVNKALKEEGKQSPPAPVYMLVYAAQFMVCPTLVRERISDLLEILANLETIRLRAVEQAAELLESCSEGNASAEPIPPREQFHLLAQVAYEDKDLRQTWVDILYACSQLVRTAHPLADAHVLMEAALSTFTTSARLVSGRAYSHSSARTSTVAQPSAELSCPRTRNSACAISRHGVTRSSRQRLSGNARKSSNITCAFLVLLVTISSVCTMIYRFVRSCEKSTLKLYSNAERLHEFQEEVPFEYDGGEVEEALVHYLEAVERAQAALESVISGKKSTNGL